MQDPPLRTGPLAGLKVLEIGHYIAASALASLLISVPR
jgi:crotonobetainyl-CoA:carnitine CoA-transferase CaiB-like acyl-CoA transferase